MFDYQVWAATMHDIILACISLGLVLSLMLFLSGGSLWLTITGFYAIASCFVPAYFVYRAFFSKCVCVCLYLCLCAYLCVYTHCMHVYACVHTCIVYPVFVSVCIPLHTYVHSLQVMYMHVCVRVKSFVIVVEVMIRCCCYKVSGMRVSHSRLTQ